MFERFTERARKAVALADQEASRLKHDYVGAEHLLLGLLAEGTGVAANALKGMGVDLEKVRGEVCRLVAPGSSPAAADGPPLRRNFMAVLGCAAEQSRRLGHNYVGTEHLLLGMLDAGENAATRALTNLGLDLTQVRNRLANLLGVEPGGKEPAAFTGAVEDTWTDLRDFVGPTMVDSMIRQAIQMCWHAMPKEGRTARRVEEEIRRLVERALKDMKEDAERFGIRGPENGDAPR